MNGSLVWRAVLSLCLFAVACHEDAPIKLPPPLPEAPAPVAVTAGARDDQADVNKPVVGSRATPPVSKPARNQSAPRKETASAAATGSTTKSEAPKSNVIAKSSAATKPVTAPRPVNTTPVPVPMPAPVPVPVPAPAPAPKPVAAAKRVVVPRTANVHVELPAGLQADLDADPRMQPWVNRVVAIADECHAKNRSARGAIQARVTMHENERPDADIRALPGQLSSIVACATGSLMRIKMPLFTGREGAGYDVRIVFE